MSLEGSAAVFYGESFGDYLGDPSHFYFGSLCTFWWDEPSAGWYVFDTPERNDLPGASFVLDCTGLDCRFDASSDRDGQVVGYRWDFGDGTRVSGDQVTSHRLLWTGLDAVTAGSTLTER